jgi:hypothetical protein
MSIVVGGGIVIGGGVTILEEPGPVTYSRGPDYGFTGALIDVDLQTFSVTYSAWTNTTGRDILLSLGQGSQIQIYSAGDPATYVITFATNWSESGGVYTVNTTFPPGQPSFYAFSVTFPLA